MAAPRYAIYNDTLHENRTGEKNDFKLTLYTRYNRDITKSTGTRSKFVISGILQYQVMRKAAEVAHFFSHSRVCYIANFVIQEYDVSRLKCS